MLNYLMPFRSEVSGAAEEQLLAPQHGRSGLGQGRDEFCFTGFVFYGNYAFDRMGRLGS